MSETIKIAIADDNTFLIKAIQDKLSFFDDLDCKIKAVNGKDLLAKLEKNPDINLILMDIEMPEIDGIEATAIIKARYPGIKIIMLTIFDNDENIFNAIQAGADGYFLKEVKHDALYKGIIETLNGGAAMNPSIALRALKLLRNPFSIENAKSKEEISLSQREIEVLEQLSKGLSYMIIADNLFLSPKTIRRHIENIYTKLQVHSKLEAIQKAKNNQLI
ncbi:response regulator [Flavobacterium sp. 3HN19-14]|uniref:response regulator n=1 Tax=Flavobacterium sp. 3HN19-14 TaxID=3448133 RepID=UPI003EDE92DE